MWSKRERVVSRWRERCWCEAESGEAVGKEFPSVFVALFLFFCFSIAKHEIKSLC